MLTLDQLQNIAAILGWSVPEVEESIAELNHGFMCCDIQFFNADPDPSIVPQGPGFYHRLSAPGYLDCTDWSGAFETEDEAVADMLQMYCD